MAGNGGEGAVGKVTCAAWIRRRDDEGPPGVSRLLVAFGRGATASSPPLVDLLEFDARASALASEPLVSGDCFPCGLWDVGEREGRSDSDRALSLCARDCLWFRRRGSSWARRQPTRRGRSLCTPAAESWSAPPPKGAGEYLVLTHLLDVLLELYLGNFPCRCKCLISGKTRDLYVQRTRVSSLAYLPMPSSESTSPLFYLNLFSTPIKLLTKQLL